MTSALDRQAQIVFACEIHRLGDIAGISRRDRIDARFGSPSIDPSEALSEPGLLADVVRILHIFDEIRGGGARRIRFQRRDGEVHRDKISTHRLVELFPCRLRWPGGIGRTASPDRRSRGGTG